MNYILFEISSVVPLATWGCEAACYGDSVMYDRCEAMTLHSSLGSSVHGILQARILECVAIPFSRGSSRPRDRTFVSHVSCIGRRILYHWAIGKSPQIFPALCPECAGVSEEETRQQDPPSLDPHWPIKYSPGHVVQKMTLDVYEVKHSVLQSHPPHFKCSVASCGQVPWCWTEQMFKHPVTTENSSGHSTPDHWGLQGNTCSTEALHMLC